jgi:hypothetical protein
MRSIWGSRRPPVMRDPQPVPLLGSLRETPSVRAIHELVPLVAKLVLLQVPLVQGDAEPDLHHPAASRLLYLLLDPLDDVRYHVWVRRAYSANSVCLLAGCHNVWLPAPRLLHSSSLLFLSSDGGGSLRPRFD